MLKILKRTLILSGIISLSFAETNDIAILKKVISEQPQSASFKDGRLKVISKKRKDFKYKIVGRLSVKEILDYLGSIKGYSIIIDNDAVNDVNRAYNWNIETNNFDEVLKAIQKQSNLWVIENPLDKTIEVKKYIWITVEPDLEGTTQFSLNAGGEISNSNNNSENNGEGNGEQTISGGGEAGFSYSIKNQDVRLFLGILSSLNIPAYPFSAGFVKMKVSPSQYEAVKTIFASLKKHSEVIVGKIEILKVDLNKANKLGINWEAFFKGFRVGQITQATLSVNLTPFSPTENPVSVALLNKAGSQEALIQFLKQYGNVKMVNTWIFETKTGTITPFGSYKEEPYITYQVITSDTTTQVVPQVEYKYAGFVGDIYVAKQKNRYFVELAINLSDIYGYFNLSMGNFTETIPEIQANQMRIATYIPHLDTTIMLTGFKLKSVEKNEYKVPFLGDIPLIGNLFKSTDKSVVNSEFVILITLHKFRRDYALKTSPQIIKEIKESQKEVNNIENYGEKKEKKIKKPYKIIVAF